MKLKIKKLHPDAVVPVYATEGAACFDLHAICAGPNTPIHQGQGVNMRTGLAFEIPPGHVMLVFSRSGHAFKHDTRLANCVGVIDSDYRGELTVRLTSDGSITDVLRINPGDRIAQARVVPFPRVEFELAQDLGVTERGLGGFGSTGS
jgi:dUTP pyrophosphatase